MRILLLSLTILNTLVYTNELPHFREMPKVELHLHLSGSYPLEYLLTIATDSQKEALLDSLERIAARVDYHEAFKVFGLIGQIVNTNEKVEQGTLALCQSMEKDGVVYAEIRTGLKDLGNGQEGYLQSVLSGIRQGTSDKFQARLLLSLQRASSLAVAKSTVDLAIKYRKQGVVGIDISGDSTIGQIETIIPELLRAREEGLFLTLHIGESPKEQGQLEILETLKPDRIGHAVHLSQDALDWVLANRIPIEICPTSGVLVQMVDDYSSLPGLSYFAQGHPTVICTDDPLIFRNYLSQEYLTLSQKTSLSVEQLCEMSKKSFEYTFLSEEEKLKVASSHFFGNMTKNDGE